MANTRIARLSDWWRRFAHRKGWIASPSLAFSGVPFGPDQRDLPREVTANLSERHQHGCPICDAPPSDVSAPARHYGMSEGES